MATAILTRFAEYGRLALAYRLLDNVDFRSGAVDPSACYHAVQSLPVSAGDLVLVSGPVDGIILAIC